MASENEDLSADPASVEVMVRAAVERSRELARSTRLLLDTATFRAGINRIDFHDPADEARDEAGPPRNAPSTARS